MLIYDRTMFVPIRSGTRSQKPTSMHVCVSRWKWLWREREVAGKYWIDVIGRWSRWIAADVVWPPQLQWYTFKLSTATTTAILTNIKPNISSNRYITSITIGCEEHVWTPLFVDNRIWYPIMMTQVLHGATGLSYKVDGFVSHADTKVTVW